MSMIYFKMFFICRGEKGIITFVERIIKPQFVFDRKALRSKVRLYLNMIFKAKWNY